MFELCASILAADFAHLERDVRAADAAGADVFHIDVMDGHFVPALSFGPLAVRAMGRLTGKPLDVHLMVEDPAAFVPELAAMGARRVSVHDEISGGPGAALAAIRAAGMSAGLVLNPETPVTAVTPWLPQLDRVLLMTVHPGRGGQACLPGSGQRIAALRSLLDQAGSPAIIQVDGGMDPRTLPGVLRAGARSVVAGSAVFGGDIAQKVAALRASAP